MTQAYTNENEDSKGNRGHQSNLYVNEGLLGAPTPWTLASR